MEPILKQPRLTPHMSWTWVAPNVHVNTNGLYRAKRTAYIGAAQECHDFKTKEEAILFTKDNSIVNGWYKFEKSIATNGDEFLVQVDVYKDGVKRNGSTRKRVSSKEEAYKLRDSVLAISMRYGSQHLKDERIDPYMGDDAVRLLPSSSICQVSVHNKREKKWVDWYEGSRRISHDVTNMNDEDISQLKELGRAKCNKYNDVITIARSSITPFHVRHYRYVQPKVEYNSTPVTVDPYFLGLWLGDGTSANTDVTTIDKKIVSYLNAYAAKLGLFVRQCQAKPRKTEVKEHELDIVANYKIKGGDKMQNTLLNDMKALNLIGNKHIPDMYLKNSPEVRLAVLAGIVDTDGYLDKNSYEVTQKNKLLSTNIVELAQSLGFYTTWKECKKACMYKGERREGVYIRIHIYFSAITPTVSKQLG